MQQGHQSPVRSGVCCRSCGLLDLNASQAWRGSTGAWTTLITNTLPGEDILVEGPWRVKHEDHYYLFYSGNINQFYAVGVRAIRRVL